MTRLFLLRHAKAKWAEPGSRDYDRALDETGKADAAKVALAMQSAGYLPELVLCSGAKRARDLGSGIRPAGRCGYPLHGRAL